MNMIYKYIVEVGLAKVCVVSLHNYKQFQENRKLLVMRRHTAKCEATI